MYCISCIVYHISYIIYHHNPYFFLSCNGFIPSPCNTQNLPHSDPGRRRRGGLCRHGLRGVERAGLSVRPGGRLHADPPDPERQGALHRGCAPLAAPFRTVKPSSIWLADAAGRSPFLYEGAPPPPGRDPPGAPGGDPGGGPNFKTPPPKF